MMRILIVGAGALGSYIGARLLATGQDVTFLVRQRRSRQLEEEGLQLDSPLGNCMIPAVRYVLANAIDRSFDLVVLACKAYDLNDAIISFTPAVGPNTAILPLLNGMAHLNVLIGAFGNGSVLGGQCMLATTLSPAGHVRHLNDAQTLTLGELDGFRSARGWRLASIFSHAGFSCVASDNILREMWEKCAFIASAMCTIILTRMGAGSRYDACARKLASAILKEIRAIAASEGVILRTSAMARALVILDSADAAWTELVADDLLHRSKTEAHVILGDLMQRAKRLAVFVPHLEGALAVVTSGGL